MAPALGDELDRCSRLGVQGLIVHPGAHLGAGEEAGIDRIARSLDEILAGLPAESPPVLLELTAGQGSTLGYKLEHQSQIRHHNVVGDWITIDAKVVDKGVDAEGRRFVNVEQAARNQHGELSALGTGIVHLPSR